MIFSPLATWEPGNTCTPATGVVFGWPRPPACVRSGFCGVSETRVTGGSAPSSSSIFPVSSSPLPSLTPTVCSSLSASSRILKFRAHFPTFFLSSRELASSSPGFLLRQQKILIITRRHISSFLHQSIYVSYCERCRRESFQPSSF